MLPNLDAELVLVAEVVDVLITMGESFFWSVTSRSIVCIIVCGVLTPPPSHAGVGGLDSGWLNSLLLAENTACEIHNQMPSVCVSGGRKCIKI